MMVWKFTVPVTRTRSDLETLTKGPKLDGGSTAGPDKPIRAMTPPLSRGTAGVR